MGWRSHRHHLEKGTRLEFDEFLLTPAEVGSVDVSAEVETGVARAIEVVTVVGAGSVSLAWAGGARVNPAVNSVTVETVVAFARPLGGAVDVWELDRAGGVGGAIVTAAAGVWDAERSVSVVVEEASAAGADGGASELNTTRATELNNTGAGEPRIAASPVK